LSTPALESFSSPEEQARREAFPVCESGIFLAHAAVTALPAAVGQAMSDYALASCRQQQEFAAVLRDIRTTRQLAARLIGARWEEVALLGPTSLGLSLFANGIEWRAGDELVCYADDYPANVYPWLELERRGVVVRRLRAEAPGAVTPELVKSALSERTRLVALASCHFFSGYRLDVEAIGALLSARGILFALDAIQTLGAFPLDVVSAHVDLLSADAHKWLLGPMAMGIVYVAERHFETVRPTLLGAWNVQSPKFLAQDTVEFVPTAQRYEPGVLNTSGVYGMKAALELLLEQGVDRIAVRLLELKAVLLGQLLPLGFEVLGPVSGPNASGITTVWHPRRPASALFQALEAANVVASLRHDRSGREYLRFSPHFYNTEVELLRVAEVLRGALAVS
jgi:cysteine desulfurase / selenocysteine lyase